MAVLLGLVVALSYGAADFLGGFASQRASAAAVAATTQAVGLALALALVALVGWDAVTANDAALSAGAGIAQVAGVTALYRGLAVGRMSMVAPVAAVTSASIPIGWGLLARGEEPGTIALAGIVLAIVAVAVVASAPEPAATAVAHRPGLLLAVLAGIGFGASFVCFGETDQASGFVPVVIARATAGPLLVGALLAARRPAIVPPSARRPAIAAGALDIAANAVLLVAVRREFMTLVAPVAALFPAATVVLARFVLAEPIGRRRLAGLGLAVVALVCIAS